MTQDIALEEQEPILPPLDITRLKGIDKIKPEDICAIIESHSQPVLLQDRKYFVLKFIMPAISSASDKEWISLMISISSWPIFNALVDHLVARTINISNAMPTVQ
jgi:hypothetical protein